MLLLKRYDALLKARPLTTKIVSSVIVAGLGDIGTQKLFEKKSKFDYKRFRNMLIMGFAIAPVLHGWYGILGSMKLLQNKTAVQQAFIMMPVDQLLFAPACITGVLFLLSYLYN